MTQLTTSSTVSVIAVDHAGVVDEMVAVLLSPLTDEFILTVAVPPLTQASILNLASNVMSAVPIFRPSIGTGRVNTSSKPPVFVIVFANAVDTEASTVCGTAH